MTQSKKGAIFGLIGIAGLAGAVSSHAGDRTWKFDVDPTSEGIIFYGNNDAPWVNTGGSPASGGFLAMTYSQNSQYAAVEFPDIDDGKIVTSFKFTADLRVGNAQGNNGRPADGFSVSFARSNDPLVTGDLSGTGSFAGGIPEGGSTTGIAVLFDTWSGNTLPDGADIEGIIVRVDNKTVNRTALPRRNGACDDPTSLQTGPFDATYWANGGDPRDPGAWAGLCWQPLVVDLNADAKLTVSWKGRNILDAFQTTFFPSPGKILLAGRTGGANENTHFDNIRLVTSASVADTTPPTTPANVKVDAAGARRIALSWGASTDDSGRVSYRVERDGVDIGGLVTEPKFEDRNVSPGKSYKYDIYAADIPGNKSPKVTINATTVAEVPGPGFLLAEVYTNISGTPVDNLLADANFPANPAFARYVNGLSYGEPNFGDTYGENIGVRIAGVLTAPESGNFYFHVRSDDASRFYINTSGAAIPDPNAVAHVAEETGCCTAFLSAPDEQVSEAIALTAGRQYGVLFLVKEGGGGDWGQVGWSKTGVGSDASVIQGGYLQGVGDPVGATVDITTAPANASVAAYKPATFSVEATTASPYTSAVIYQWYKNGALIPGATSKSYTVAVAQPADNGTKYKVLVAVPGKSATSAEATLTVTDSAPAMISKIDGSDSFTTATISFDQPVAAASANVAGNYALSGGLTVSKAELVGDRTVVLTTSRQTEGTSYTVTVSNVANLGGKPVAAGTTGSLKSWIMMPSRARLEQWLNISGTPVQGLLDDPRYPASPDVVRFADGLSFGQPSFGNTYGENHGIAIKGILKPTETASYRFFVRSDDASQLFINTSGATIPDGKTGTPIAFENGCCAAFAEPPNDRTSEPVSLTAGQSYGVLFLVKEGGGGDWGQVAWRKNGDTTAAGSLTYIKDAIHWYGPQATAVGPLAVSVTGGNVRVTFEGTLQSAPAISGPWTDVAGASGGVYTTAPSAGQAYFRSRN